MRSRGPRTGGRDDGGGGNGGPASGRHAATGSNKEKRIPPKPAAASDEETAATRIQAIQRGRVARRSSLDAEEPAGLGFSVDDLVQSCVDAGVEEYLENVVEEQESDCFYEAVSRGATPLPPKPADSRPAQERIAPTAASIPASREEAESQKGPKQLEFLRDKAIAGLEKAICDGSLEKALAESFHQRNAEEEKNHCVERSETTSAAVRIQAVQRGNAQRKLLQEEKERATQIQAAFRGRASRRRSEEMQAEKVRVGVKGAGSAPPVPPDTKGEGRKRRAAPTCAGRPGPSVVPVEALLEAAVPVAPPRPPQEPRRAPGGGGEPLSMQHRPFRLRPLATAAAEAEDAAEEIVPKAPALLHALAPTPSYPVWRPVESEQPPRRQFAPYSERKAAGAAAPPSRSPQPPAAAARGKLPKLQSDSSKSRGLDMYRQAPPSARSLSPGPKSRKKAPPTKVGSLTARGSREELLPPIGGDEEAIQDWRRRMAASALLFARGSDMPHSMLRPAARR